MKRSLFKTPGFWFEKKSIVAFMLLPLSYLYRGASYVYTWVRLRQQIRCKVPVVCVGNLTLGGAGKTPSTLALTHLFKKHFHGTPHILSRGYGSAVKEVHRVQPHDTSAYVGDEPLLLSRMAPTWVYHDRTQSSKCAVNDGAKLLIMDDGLQNPTLVKDVTFLVVDEHQKFGNEYVFPAGPLRTSITHGMKDVDAIIFIRSASAPGKSNDHDFEKRLRSFKKPLFLASIKALPPLKPQSVIVFTGLGYPEKFKQTLVCLGFDVVAFFPFPDHHSYTLHDLEMLKNYQRQWSYPVITTEKDWVKLEVFKRGTIIEQQAFHALDMHVLPITLCFKDEERVVHFLEQHLKIDRVE